ncbi:MAG: hypothetical protein IJ370_07050 [Oscillospiraceae bacterium]|nr:hypothetical protein [Oscillospiraceae bacterium]
MLKKIVSVAMAVFMLLCVAACGKAGAGGEKNDEIVAAKHVPLSEEEYYQYSFLNDEEKEVYRRIRKCILSGTYHVDVSDCDVSDYDLDKVVACFFSDNPQFSWASGAYGTAAGDSITIHVEEKDIKANEQKQQALDEAVDQVVSMIDPTDSEYEKELAIHDYLTRTVCYDKESAGAPFIDGIINNAYCTYGALVEKRAVCVGYVEAFQYLCYQVGINACQVYGEGHVWNAVKIDGEWYQVDVTWDDPIDGQGNSGDGNHKYFNLTSDQMYKVHPLSTLAQDAYYNVPECISTKNAYKGNVVDRSDNSKIRPVAMIITGVFVLIYISVGKANDKRKSKRRK